MENTRQNMISSPLALLLERGYKITPIEYFREATQLFGQNPMPFVVFGIIAFFLNFIGSMAMSLIPIIGNIAGQVLTITLFAGHVQAAEHLDRHRTLRLEVFFRPFERIVPFIVYSSILFLLVAIPIIAVGVVAAGVGLGELFDAQLLLEGFEYIAESPQVLVIAFLVVIVAGFYLGTAYLLVTPLILFEGMPAWEAMELSRKLTEKQFTAALGIFVVTIMVNIVGLVMFGVGLLATMPICFMAVYVFYRHLTEQAGGTKEKFFFDDDQPLDAGFQ